MKLSLFACLAPAGSSFRTLALALAAVCVGGSAAAQSLPRYVNFGDLNGYASGEAGYELLSETASPPGISLSATPLDTVHVAGNFPNAVNTLPPGTDILSADPDELVLLESHRRTSLLMVDPTVVTVTGLSPSTTYRLMVEMGALTPWYELTSPCCWTPFLSNMNDARIEVGDGAGGFTTVASNIRCTTGAISNKLGEFIAAIVPVWFLAGTDATGTLSFRLSTDGTDQLFAAGMQIHDHEALPVFYQRVLTDSLNGTTPGVGPFVTAFNAGDYDLAEALALGLSDPFERGVSLTHLVGWLTGTRSGGLHLVDEAVAALQLASPSHPAAAWLIHELGSLQRALDHLHASARTAARVCPDQGGPGFLNKDCSGQTQASNGLLFGNANAQVAFRELWGMTAPVVGSTVLDDLADWNAGSLSASDWEPSPLVFAALKLIGTTMVDMNPNMASNATAAGTAFSSTRNAILNGFVDLGFAAADFGADLELSLYKTYLAEGTNIAAWEEATIAGLFSASQIDDSWWGPLVELPALDASAPEWANRQREIQSLLRSIADYWLQDRLEAGEFGGGIGDDIEAMAQLALIFSGRQDQSDRRRLDKLDDLVRYVLDESGEVQNGYFAGGIVDVEHSAEYTTNTGITHRAAFGHSGRLNQVGLGVAEHLLYAQDPASAFAGVSNLGRVHFKSFWFTEAGPDAEPDHAHDVLLNGRALHPALGQAFHAPLPETHPLVADLISYADAWLADAMDTTGGKPVGLVGPAQWPTNEFGDNGFWWTYTGVSADLGELLAGLHGFPLDVLRMAYHRSSSPNRWMYLIPAARFFRSVSDWEVLGQPANPALGSFIWGGRWFKDSSSFGSLVISYLADLQNDPTLTTTVDPDGIGNTYVDAVLLTKMEDWAEQGNFGQLGTIRYALRDVNACNGTANAKSPGIFINGLNRLIPYYRSLFPLLTTHALHTDRLFLSYKNNGPASLLTPANGQGLDATISFQPLISWRSQMDGGQDIAVLCNSRDYDGTVYSAFAYNFEAAALSTTMQLDEGLQPGTYLLEYGEADETCDSFPLGGLVHTDTVVKRGSGASVEVPLEPGLNLVRVTRTGAAPAPGGYDLALDTPVVEKLIARDGSTRFRLKVRASNMAGVASPGAVLEFHVALLGTEGELLQTSEQLLGTLTVPSLAASTGWTIPQVELVLGLPGSPQPAGHGAVQTGGAFAGRLAKKAAVPGLAGGGAGGPPALTPAQSVHRALQSGLGLQVRAVLVADGTEGDLLNNEQTRGWLQEDMPVTQR
jgi:hypothetical protein